MNEVFIVYRLVPNHRYSEDEIVECAFPTEQSAQMAIDRTIAFVDNFSHNEHIYYALIREVIPKWDITTGWFMFGSNSLLFSTIYNITKDLGLLSPRYFFSLLSSRPKVEIEQLKFKIKSIPFVS